VKENLQSQKPGFLPTAQPESPYFSLRNPVSQFLLSQLSQGQKPGFLPIQAKSLDFSLRNPVSQVLL